MAEFSLAEALAEIEQSNTFSTWKKQNPACFLTSIVVLLQDAVESVQANYALPEQKELYSFSSDATEPKKSPPLKENIAVQPLTLANTLSLKDALRLAHEEKEKQHKAEQLKKTLAILQQEQEAIWNITFITASIKTINIKVTNEGKIKHYDCSALIDFA